MHTYKFNFKTSPDKKDIIIAFLSEAGFETFEEISDNEFNGYIRKPSFGKEEQNRLTGLAEMFDFQYNKELIEDENWNRLWETNFTPVIVNDFCAIRANFHEPIFSVEHEIVITPKMAFGTGHHATTFMMIEEMRNVNFLNKTVLDYGCGTGILSILASKLNAKSIEAVDIELPSYQNTIENCRINVIHNVNTIHGQLKDVPETTFDIILANINRNVILDSLSDLFVKLEKAGHLLISGILKEDEKMVAAKAEEAGFTKKSTKTRKDWVMIHLMK